MAFAAVKALVCVGLGTVGVMDTRRLDVRLESFLRRQVSPEVYERISTSEACVLISAEERRVHRYVVLGHRQLFTTEFPPKNLKLLLNLEAILSIRKVSVRLLLWQHKYRG